MRRYVLSVVAAVLITAGAANPAYSASEYPSGCNSATWNTFAENCNGWHITVRNDSAFVLEPSRSSRISSRFSAPSIPADGVLYDAARGLDSIGGPGSVRLIYHTSEFADIWYRWVDVSRDGHVQCGVGGGEYSFKGVGCEDLNPLGVRNVIDRKQAIKIRFLPVNDSKFKISPPGGMLY